MNCAQSKSFLEMLARFPRNAFERWFSAISLGFELCHHLTRAELNLLYDAALLGIICSVSINRTGDMLEDPVDCELRRTRLERSFVQARNQFLATRGWGHLPRFKQNLVQQHYLRVCVNEQNLRP